METWLILTTYSLTDNIKKQPNKSFVNNICCLLIIYFKLNMLRDFCSKAKHAELLSSLLQNLAVDSSSALETCINIFGNAYEQLFLQSLLNFINKTINCHPSLTEWIFAIPFVHFLMGQNSNLTNVEWNEDPANFKYVHL